MHFIIFDLEATCWQDRGTNNQHETIEIGAVKIDRSGTSIDEFSAFVRPHVHPVLSAFCTELTTIRQEDVDNAESFPVAIERFQKWINLETPYCLCSWGFYDRKQLSQDADLHGLSKEWLQHHISLKHQYADIRRLKRPIGMGGALKQEHLTLEGTHHRGIDDARNIAKIFLRHIDRWEIR